ncbi:hypothetical protein L1987_82218 [Smallanthus sonchifolius]|uniref:Uncharacterized protein n=1 Tax=Smallanthus sonchifolius TaxID=185202 RepID=A0ACB8YB13_9ASTR|nr:hypothetical protein L1987_82218 [Smallanthus sonchifolius]
MSLSSRSRFAKRPSHLPHYERSSKFELCCREEENFSTEIIEHISPEDLQPTVKICVDSLSSSSVAVKRSAAAKLRLVAKNRSDNRALINGSNRGKKDALTTLYKLCSMKTNKKRAVTAGVVKPLVELVVAAGEAAKEQGAVGMAEKAMVVLSTLAAVEEGKTAIVEEGGIPALVEVIEDGASVKGKEFAVVTLTQLCEGVNSVRNRGLLVGEVKDATCKFQETNPGCLLTYAPQSSELLHCHKCISQVSSMAIADLQLLILA